MKKLCINYLIIVFALMGCVSNEPTTILQPYSFQSIERLEGVDSRLEIKRIEGKSNNIWVVNEALPSTIEIDLDITASLVVDVSNQEALYIYNVLDQIIPASLTKVLTALVVMDYGHLDEEVIIEHNFDNLIYNAKRSGIKKGDVLTLEQLLYGLLINSGNDCAIAIAEHISGSVEEFSILMNEKAKAIGATHSQFKNPHGLNEEGHYSTVYDFYLIFNEALQDDFLKSIMNQNFTRVIYNNVEGLTFVQTWQNTNQFLQASNDLLNDDVEVLGGKTGFVTDSGYNLILFSYINQRPIISIIIGSKSKKALYENMASLLNEIS
jgi:D-alanyl-D-alanine carboxypeptidase (penicillin-binding protein 5/6)